MACNEGCERVTIQCAVEKYFSAVLFGLGVSGGVQRYQAPVAAMLEAGCGESAVLSLCVSHSAAWRRAGEASQDI